MTRLGVNHGTVSGAQQTLYRAFARTGAKLTWQDVSVIEAKALIVGGMAPDVAAATVAKAMAALKAAGIGDTTKIPWGTKL